MTGEVFKIIFILAIRFNRWWKTIISRGSNVLPIVFKFLKISHSERGTCTRSACEQWRFDRRRSGIQRSIFVHGSSDGNRFSKNERQLDYAFRSSYSDGSFLSLLRGARMAVDFETMPLVERRERITVSETLLSIFPALHTVPLFSPVVLWTAEKKKKNRKRREKRKKKEKIVEKEKKKEQERGRTRKRKENMEQRLIVVQFERWLVALIERRCVCRCVHRRISLVVDAFRFSSR